jgi:hypothetical protein
MVPRARAYAAITRANKLETIARIANGGQSASDDGRALHLLTGVGEAGFELTSSFTGYKIVLTSTGAQRRAD